MSVMKYAIIENEEVSRDNLKNDVMRLRPNYQLLFTAESIDDTVTCLKSNPQVELLFMDIELTDGNSFEIFRRTQVTTPIIFTTAYNDFAIQAFKVNSIDYLLKPFSLSELEKAILKFEQLSVPVHPDYSALVQAFSNKTGRDRILINVGDNYSFVNTADVAWFQREEKYVYAVMNNGRRHITDYQNLSDVEQQMDSRQFFRLSRNIVVSITAIAKVSKWLNSRLKVTVKSGDDTETFLVSSSRRNDFLDWMGGK